MEFLIEEEYGYRYWVWKTDKTHDEMIDWWINLETVNPFFFNPSKSLPFGNVSPLSEDCMEIPELRGYIHLHEDDDSHMSIDEETFYHKGFEPL